MSGSKPPKRQSSTGVAEFLQQAANLPAKQHTGRLIFALDATAIREALIRYAQLNRGGRRLLTDRLSHRPSDHDRVTAGHTVCPEL